MRPRVAWAVGWGVGVGLALNRRRRKCLRPVYNQTKVGIVDNMTATAVLVPAETLGDLTELARRAAAALEMVDPALASALRGATAQVHVSAIPDVDPA